MLLVKEKDGSKRLGVDYLGACENNLRSGHSHIREAHQKRGGIAVDPSRVSAVLQWTCEESFQQWKQRLTSASMLNLPDANESLKCVVMHQR
ncbi:hypothetical protein L195_g056129 [Trifolium pratense]|uniref:Uncharacterized protein n=1 Tax=Trifolium pratense TaxID=57577 RepID=A0A2K3KQ36_TRIPR|nr:hypothetical protein L195_g056129 [Trifolium pratense]